MLHEHNLHDYQKRAVEHVIEHPKCGLFLEMGLGKTISSLTAVKKILYELIECNKTLIVAPKRVAENVWTSELDKWSHLSNMSASIIMGPPKQREAALRVEADVYLISRDNFAWLVTHFGGSYLPFDMLIIDESSSFKSHKSVRFKALRQVQHNFKRAVLLTGTPAPQSLIDLWPQLYILDRGERLGKTMTAFRSEFFRPGMTNGHVVYNYRPLKGSQERIFDRIKDICMSMKARDYLDMPEAQIIPVPIKMDPATQDQYNRFEEEQVLEMLESMEEGQAISAANAAGLNNKLLQFANGAVYDEDKVWHEVHTLKLDAIEELIEAANGQPVLIAWTYRSDRDRLLERLKKYKPREHTTRINSISLPSPLLSPLPSPLPFF